MVRHGRQGKERSRRAMQEPVWFGRRGYVWSGRIRYDKERRPRRCTVLRTHDCYGQAATANQGKLRRNRAEQTTAGQARRGTSGADGLGRSGLSRHSYATAHAEQAATEGVDTGRPPPARDSSADSSASNAPQSPVAVASVTAGRSVDKK